MSNFLGSSTKDQSVSTQTTTTTTNVEDNRRAVTDQGILLESGSSLGGIDRSTNTNIRVEQLSDDVANQAIVSNTGLAGKFIDNVLGTFKEVSLGAKGEAERANALATKFFDETARINKQQAFGLEGEILGNVKTVVILGIAIVGLYFITKK